MGQPTCATITSPAATPYPNAAAMPSATARSERSPRWITLWGARNLPSPPDLRWSAYSSVRFVPIWMAMEPVRASAKSSQSRAPSVAASAEPTSTGATDAVSEKGRAAQNQEAIFG